MLSNTSIWLILALILAGMEMLTGTFFMLALAIGFACGSLAAWLGFSFPLQISIAATISIIVAILLRRWRSRQPHPTTHDFLDVGQRVMVIDWHNNKLLRVQHRGSQWNAELTDDAESGHSHYYIVAVRGTTLLLHHQPPEPS